MEPLSATDNCRRSSADDVRAAMAAICKLTGSSGGGRWSTVFGFADNPGFAWSAEYKQRLAIEAADLRTTVGSRLADVAKTFLDTLIALGRRDSASYGWRDFDQAVVSAIARLDPVHILKQPGGGMTC